jgi:hypothetical protein
MIARLRPIHWLRAGLLALLGLFALAPAHAHKPSDSYLALDVKGQQVTGQWDIALRDLDMALNLDLNGDGDLTWDELRSQHPQIAAYALARLALSTDKGACPVTLRDQLVDDHTDGAYTVLRFSATCAAPVSTLTVGYRLFAEFDPQHKGLLKLSHDGIVSTAIFSPDQASQALSLATPDRLAQFGDYVRNGIWHIWIGVDHILFLLSLLLPAVLVPAAAAQAQTLRAAFIDVLKVVTAFTLAHSLTLTLASLHVLALPSRWVESAIAASVIFAALNNIVPLFRGRRPVAAFVFGLVHGFGFAGVLADLGLPQGALVLSLAGFNVGVEIGQLAIVAVFLPLAFLLRRSWFYRQLMTTGSAVIVLIATVWLVERAFDLKLMPV